MRAIVVEHPGGPEVLTLKEVETPKVKAGWSLVQIKGFGINHSEIFTRQGLSTSVVFPRILGIECVGIISETTDEDRLPIGQTVVSIMGEMGRAFDGGYAEYALLPNDQIYSVKTNLDWVSLATLPETYYTAYQAYESLQIKENDKVLVRGATSGLGPAFLKLVHGKYPGVKVSGSTRNLNKAVPLIKLGYSDVIEEKNGVLQTDENYDKVLELIGPATVKDSLLHTNEFGIVCSCGQLGGKWYLENFDPIMELGNNRYLTSAYSGIVSQDKIQKLIDFVSDHHINIAPSNIFRLEEVAEAHRLMESGNNIGKNIVIIE